MTSISPSPCRIRWAQAAIGFFIALIALPGSFFAGSVSILFVLAGGIVLGSSIAVNRGVVLCILWTLAGVAATVGLFALFVKAVE